MRKILIFILPALIAGSCVSKRACERKFPPQSKVIRKDSIVYTKETIYKDTTVYVHIPGEVDTGSVPVIIIKEGLMFSEKSHLFTSFADSWAWVEQGKLLHRLSQKDTLMKKELENAVRETWEKAEKYFSESKTVTVEVNRLTGWQHFQIWAFRIFASIFLVWLLIRLSFPGLFS